MPARLLISMDQQIFENADNGKCILNGAIYGCGMK